MADLRKRFSTEDDANFEAMAKRSCHPEVIGKTPPDIQTYWLKCSCSMLTITSAELAGQDVVCQSCRQEARDRVDGLASSPASSTMRPAAMRPKTERRMLFALVAFCILSASFFGSRLSDAPPRAHADQLQLD